MELSKLKYGCWLTLLCKSHFVVGPYSDNATISADTRQLHHSHFISAGHVVNLTCHPGICNPDCTVTWSGQPAGVATPIKGKSLLSFTSSSKHNGTVLSCAVINTADNSKTTTKQIVLDVTCKFY